MIDGGRKKHWELKLVSGEPHGFQDRQKTSRFEVIVPKENRPTNHRTHIENQPRTEEEWNRLRKWEMGSEVAQ